MKVLFSLFSVPLHVLHIIRSNHTGRGGIQPSSSTCGFRNWWPVYCDANDGGKSKSPFTRRLALWDNLPFAKKRGPRFVSRPHHSLHQSSPSQRSILGGQASADTSGPHRCAHLGAQRTQLAPSGHIKIDITTTKQRHARKHISSICHNIPCTRMFLDINIMEASALRDCLWETVRQPWLLMHTVQCAGPTGVGDLNVI